MTLIRTENESLRTKDKGPVLHPETYNLQPNSPGPRPPPTEAADRDWDKAAYAHYCP